MLENAVEGSNRPNLNNLEEEASERKKGAGAEMMKQLEK